MPVGRRGWVLIAILVAGVWALSASGLGPRSVLPSRGGLAVVGQFMLSAFQPALDGATIRIALDAARRTMVFAAAAMSLSLIIGIALGFPASAAWWEGDPAGGSRWWRRFLARAGGPMLWGTARTLIVLMRSVHELLWAVLFLAALGLNTFAAVVAIAIPYGGTLAKIFSEMIDETDRRSGQALRAAGASGVQVFLFGLLPRAAPDMASYAFYRFECSVRASAVLGFFGYPTLGYHIRQSFDNLYYAQVWTYLYMLFVLVIVLDVWSAKLRRRFVAYE